MIIHDTDTFIKMNDWPANNVPKWVFVHHTGGTKDKPLADTSHHTAQIAEDWHLKKGWDGLGYHYFIEKDGKVWAGRPEHRNGAHARGYNTKSIGICLAGNFDLTHPTQEQTDALTQLLKDIVAKHNIPIKNIIPHRTVANKSCYGWNLKDDWAQNLLRQVNALANVPTYDLLVEFMSRDDKHAVIDRYFSNKK